MQINKSLSLTTEEGYWCVNEYDVEGRQVISKRYFHGQLRHVISHYKSEAWPWLDVQKIHFLSVNAHSAAKLKELEQRKEQLEKELAELKAVLGT